jgi:hypothetical protein
MKTFKDETTWLMCRANISRKPLNQFMRKLEKIKVKVCMSIKILNHLLDLVNKYIKKKTLNK